MDDVCQMQRLVCVISLGLISFFHSTARPRHATVHPYPSIHFFLLFRSALLRCQAILLLSSRRRRLSATRSRSYKEKRMADGSGSDWEVVSLTASTYAAAPGPTSPTPPLLPIHETEFPPNPPAHFFMSQHFNLPLLFSTHLESSGRQEPESGGPAVPDGDARHLNMPRPEIFRESERDDAPVLASPAAGNGLQEEGQGGGELQQTTMLCSLPDAAAVGSDATAVGADAPLPAPAAACNPNAARAWWEKTFSFPRNNGTGPLAFRFVFVAGKLQIQEDAAPEFGAGGQSKVKAGMLGGSPVAQQG